MTQALVAAAAAVLALAGCAALNALDTEVVELQPLAGRAARPTTYAFERLPSQQANPQAAAGARGRGAARGRGRRLRARRRRRGAPTSACSSARAITATDRSPYDDPFWYGAYGWGPYHRSFYGRYGRGYWGPGWVRTGAPTGATAPGVRATPTPLLRARGRDADPRPQERRAALRGARQQRAAAPPARSACCRRCSRPR